MSRGTRLANHLERTVTGPMWHGPALVEALAGVDAARAADVRRLDDVALDAKVPGLPYPAGILLDGVVEHGTYHGGQIALLRKA